VRVEGDTNWAKGEAGDTHSSVREIDVPKAGKLHIEMKDGTATDIDLAKVKRITVR
jgi:hypothetical protein